MVIVHPDSNCDEIYQTCGNSIRENEEGFGISLIHPKITTSSRRIVSTR
jgi:hypothetical protein